MTKATMRDFFNGDEFARMQFNKKYAQEGEDVNDVFNRVVNYAVSVEPETDAAYWRNIWFNMMSHKEFLPGGRILAGAGIDSKVSLINCTTVALSKDRNGNEIDPDSIEAIFEAAYMFAKVQSRGEGVGIDVSNLRPKNVKTNNAAKSSTGAVSWMELYSWVTGTISQTGRRGASLISIDVSHPDVEDFIRVKSENTDWFSRLENIKSLVNNAEIITELEELQTIIDQLQKVKYSNISVRLTDDFMFAYNNGIDWVLHWGDEVKKVDARKLMKLIAEQSYNYAEPGVLFWDTSVRLSNSDAVGYPVVGLNACSEQVLSHGSSCTLSNINLAAIPGYLNEEEEGEWLRNVAAAVLHFLDNIVECQIRDERSGLKVQIDDLSNLRRVGVGFTGLGDYFFKRGIQYDSKLAIETAGRLMKEIMIGAYGESARLAKIRGSYKAFDFEKLNNGKSFYSQLIAGKMDQRIKEVSGYDIKEGMRNVCCLTVPPVGTGSIILGSSSGVEPIFNTYYWRRTRNTPEINPDGTPYPYEWHWSLIIHPLVSEELGDVLANKTDREKISIIDDYYKDKFVPATDISPIRKVHLMSEIQRYNDSSISVTYNMSKSKDSIEDIEAVYAEAHRCGLKGVAVYVDDDKNREPILQIKRPKSYNLSYTYQKKYGDFRGKDSTS